MWGAETQGGDCVGPARELVGVFQPTKPLLSSLFHIVAWRCDLFHLRYALCRQIASPACTELEMVVMDWLAKLLELPGDFLSTGKGGGVIQV